MMKILPLLLLLAGCASNPGYAVSCRDAAGCGAVVVNPEFGPIQAQAVAPERPRRMPF